MPKTPTTTKHSKSDQHSDAWERFERAVDAAIKGGPRHRPPKPPAAKRVDQKKPKR